MIYGIIIGSRKFLKIIGKPIASNNIAFVLEMPFRSVARMSNGKVSPMRLEGLLMMINGKTFKRFAVIIKSAFKKYKGEIL